MTPHRHPDDTDADLPPQLPPLPCPFCGATPLLLRAHAPGFFVSCESPSCHQRPENTFDTPTPELAAERWNTRPAAHAV